MSSQSSPASKIAPSSTHVTLRARRIAGIVTINYVPAPVAPADDECADGGPTNRDQSPISLEQFSGSPHLKKSNAANRPTYHRQRAERQLRTPIRAAALFENLNFENRRSR